MKKRAMLIGMAIAIAFQGLNPLQRIGELSGKVEAGFTRKQNENAYILSFNDTSAIATANLREAWVKLNGGTLTLDGGSTGEIVTRSLEGIKSLKSWNTIDVEANFPYTSKLFITALDCTTDVPIPGAINLEYNQSTTSHSIVGVSKDILCMKLKVTLQGYDHNGNIFSPSLNKITVRYVPLPVQTTSIESVPATVTAGSNVTYKVLYQNSYAEEAGLVLYVPLPTIVGSVASGITTPTGTEDPYVAQLPNGASATIFNDGKFTSTAITVNGVAIPANSIYWDIGVVSGGVAGSKSFSISVPGEQVNGTKRYLQSYIQGERGEVLVTSAETVTTINSKPLPEIKKTTTAGTMRWNNQDYAYIAGGNTLVTYSVTVANGVDASSKTIRYPRATEAIRTPVVKDNLSQLWSQLQTSCGLGGTLSSYITNISDGGTLNSTTNEITWNLSRMAISTYKTVSFTLNIAGCAGATGDVSLTNNASFAGANSPQITDNHTLIILQKLTGNFAFGKQEQSWSSTKKYYDGDAITYRLSIANAGPLRAKGLTITDTVPSQIQLTLTDGGTIATNQVGIVSKSGNTVTATTSGSINSPYFRGTTGENSDYADNSSFVLSIPGRITMGTGFCAAQSIINTGSFKIEQVSTSHHNADTDLVNNLIQATVKDQPQHIQVYPKTPELTVNVTADKTHGKQVAKVNEKITYTVTVQNTGRGATAANTQLVLTPPTVELFGSGVKIPLLRTDNTVLTPSPDGKIYIPLGTIAAGGTSTAFKFTLEIPQGARYYEQIQLNVGVQAEDPNGCSVSIIPERISLTVDGKLQLSLRKESQQGYVLSGNYVEYQLYAKNAGETSTSQTWIIDRISSNASFVEAYLTGHASFMGYNCGDCEVRFATSADLPAEFDLTQPFTEAMISGALAKFKLAKQNAQGARVPGDGVNFIPLDEVKYVAYLVDQKVNTTKVFAPSITPRIVGIKLQERGSVLGRNIINEIAGFSKDLLFTIGEPKRVSVNLYPGLLPELYSTTLGHDKLETPKIVEVCKPFIREAPYYNNGTEPAKEATLTLLLPNHTTLYTGTNAITHIWSAETLAGFPSLPATEQTITHEPFITVTEADDPRSTSILLDITQYLGTGLRHGDEGMKGRWGVLRVKVVPDCNIISNTELTAKLIGFYNVDDIKYGRSENTDTVIIQNPDLEIKKTIQGHDPKSNPEFIIGEEVGYILNITNHGNAAALEVVVEDTLPLGMCYITGSAKMTSPVNKTRDPIVIGDCEAGEQVVLKRVDLTYPGVSTGTIPGKGKFQMTYSGLILHTVPLGTELENHAIVTTETKQDDLYPHEDEETITVPKPDLRVTITSPKTVDGGSPFAYTIHYNNKTITQQEQPYLIITLPNRTATTTADPGVKFWSIATGAADEQLYYLACPYVGTAPATDRESDAFPAFDRENPTSGGWTATPLANPCYIAVKIDQPLKKSASNRKLTLYVQATDPSTNKKIDAGTRLKGEVMITGKLPDANPIDNYANSITKVPAIDLWVTITATPSGPVPGVLPGGTITYQVAFGNAGKEQSCGNLISITGDTHLTIKDATIDFTTLILENSLKLPVDPTDPYELPITSPVAITSTPISNGYTFALGDVEVCIPGGAQGSFSFQAEVKKDTLDSTTVRMATSIRATDGQIEDYLENNYDRTETYVYRPDVTTRKTGTSTSDPSGETAKAGDTIKYTVSYDNIGNYDAEHTLIEETIPEWTCFTVGSISGVTPDQIAYSTGMTRDYVPIADSEGQDCAVQKFRINLWRLWAPRNQLHGEFRVGDSGCTEAICCTGVICHDKVAGTITIDNGISPAITIMDKNIWAIVVGTGAESYGYHFQRGRNVGFPHSADGPDAITLAAVPGPQTLAVASEHNNFIKVSLSDRLTPQNHNLRWGSGDALANGRSGTNYTQRQGPCPEGFHIPSAGERNELLTAWMDSNPSLVDGKRASNWLWKADITTGADLKFVDDFLLPFAGKRYCDAASVADREWWGRYWSSSPVSSLAYIFGIEEFYINAWRSYTRSAGVSLRCFQNPVEPPRAPCETETITIGDIKIAACNVGATEEGTWVNSYGHHFQRWRNVAFPHSANGSDAITTAAVSGPQTLAEANGHTNFIKGTSSPNDWLTPSDNNLRWGSGDTVGNRHGADTDGAGRQGPCPAGFHVPGVGEWDVLLEYRRSVSSGDFPEATLNNPWPNPSNISGANVEIKFTNDLLLPRAGSRAFNNANVGNRGSLGDYLTSSPAFSPGGSTALSLRSLSIGLNNTTFRSIAYSLRCFQNPTPG